MIPTNVWEWIIKIEGGDADDPDDRGGRTRYGISDGRDGVHDGLVDGKFPIDEITPQFARTFYEKEYWLKFRCNEMPPYCGLLMFDAAVNHRPRTAARLVQKAVGAYADGIVGPKTVEATQRADRRMVLDIYFIKRALLYHDIVTANASQAKFLAGWFKRLFWLRDETT